MIKQRIILIAGLALVIASYIAGVYFWKRVFEKISGQKMFKSNDDVPVGV